ncbi:hypothetical protein EV702DRAFT_1283230 [Suillus placidus]|uniref:Uncharacterized protein n=1 Tax=Suillus placidus TaxID=48579 RepID=A0A9P6ZGX5_9AGAM|nr:hypothetical protein EV702DRAFT_1283230 [Suillus placidus]
MNDLKYDYSTSVHLFPISHAALASLSAFAVASSSAIPSSSVSLAQTIGTIVDILAGVDDALQLYNRAVENWRDQLGHLIKLKEDIAAILRDWEILVTRLIKVSKSSKDTGSSSSTTKLLQAQEELRACEAHLAAKELELEGLRVSIAREGLGARCRAIIVCGWAWGELGKEGLRALQSLDVSSSNGQVPESPSASFSSHLPSASITLSQQKPLPTPALPLHVTQSPISYSPDISSLTLSQSASQQHYSARPVILIDLRLSTILPATLYTDSSSGVSRLTLMRPSSSTGMYCSSTHPVILVDPRIHTPPRILTPLTPIAKATPKSTTHTVTTPQSPCSTSPDMHCTHPHPPLHFPNSQCSGDTGDSRV